jgi:GNAT superfamily N-acetyltransferase
MHEPRIEFIKRIELPDGREADILHAGCPMPPTEGAKLAWFLDFALEDDAKPNLFVTATAKGKFEDAARNNFAWAEIDGQMVSAAWMIMPDDDPRIGSIGEVYTAPSERGLGLARQTCAALLRVFDRRSNGEPSAVYLGTTNPTAARIYAELGFTPYPERLWRRAMPTGAEFDEAWFAPGRVHFHALHWGDMPRLAALYGAPNPWVAASYPDGFFSADLVRHGRCNSFMKFTWQGTRRGLWMGMFNESGALVGSCPAYPRGNECEIIGGEIDLFIHPAFVRPASDLLRATLDALRGQGWRWLMAQVPAQDGEKHTILSRHGFETAGTLPGALSIEGVRQDVHILRASL